MFEVFSAKAILLGSAAAVAVIIVEGVIIGFTTAFIKLASAYRILVNPLNTAFLLVQILCGVIACMAGGYVAGHIAKDFSAPNSIAVGIVGTFLNLALLPSIAKYPRWYKITGILLAIPASYLGSLLIVNSK